MLESLVNSNLGINTVLNAIPSYVFIVDHELRISFANKQAMELIGPESQMMLRRLCGEVLHCIHERESSKDCGHTEFCGDCILRQAINTSNHDKSVFREKYKMALDLNGQNNEIDFLVTASPIHHDGNGLFLMVLEDITELTRLRILTTICMTCTKVRNEHGNWEKIHAYLARNEKLIFSHGYCPECGAKVEEELLNDFP